MIIPFVIQNLNIAFDFNFNSFLGKHLPWSNQIILLKVGICIVYIGRCFDVTPPYVLQFALKELYKTFGNK